MRTLSILTAAAIGLAASFGLANAQATNFAPYSGTAEALYGNGTSEAMNSRAMVRRHHLARRHYVRVRSHIVRPAPHVIARPAHTMSPAMYHAGDPQYWR